MNGRSILVLLSLLLPPGAWFLQAAGKPPDGRAEGEGEGQILALVRQLGSDRYAEREAAQIALLAQGEKLVPILDRLGPQSDPEVQVRLGRIRRDLVGYVEDIRGALAGMPDGKDDPEPPPGLLEVIASHQPRSGDLLLSFIADPAGSLHRRAVTAFVQAWDTMTADQIDAYCQRSIELKATHRPRYPQGVDASLGMSYGVRYDWGGWPRENKVRSDTRTTHYLDGKPYGQPFSYHGPKAGTGWVHTKDLGPGRHTVSLAMGYEFTHGRTTRKGRIRSQEFPFDIVPAATPDDLIAPGDQTIDRAVHDSLRMAETEEGFSPRPVFFVGRNAEGKLPDPWTPQITWTSSDGQGGSLHVPVWKLMKELPVDLCFEVEIHDVKTGQVFAGSAMVLRRGETTWSARCFCPTQIDEFVRGRSGFVPVKIVLKPSRALALTFPEITRYYPGSITSDVLRVKIAEKREAPDEILSWKPGKTVTGY